MIRAAESVPIAVYMIFLDSGVISTVVLIVLALMAALILSQIVGCWLNLLEWIIAGVCLDIFIMLQYSGYGLIIIVDR